MGCNCTHCRPRARDYLGALASIAAYGVAFGFVVLIAFGGL